MPRKEQIWATVRKEIDAEDIKAEVEKLNDIRIAVELSGMRCVVAKVCFWNKGGYFSSNRKLGAEFEVCGWGTTTDWKYIRKIINGDKQTELSFEEPPF